MHDENRLRRMLENATTIAVIGCSPKPERDSHRVAAYLQSVGYRMIPINPGVDEILGETSYPDVTAIPAEITIDIADVFRRPEHIPGVLDTVLERGAGTLWLQLGCSHPESEERARQAGLGVVSDLCIKIEHRRLLGE